MSSKSLKTQQVNCEQENKTVVLSWLEVSHAPYVPSVIRNISCGRLFDCQTKYETIDNIPDNCVMKKSF